MHNYKVRFYLNVKELVAGEWTGHIYKSYVATYEFGTVSHWSATVFALENLQKDFPMIPFDGMEVGRVEA